MVLNTLALLISRPFIIPALLGASGLYYGGSELTFSAMGTIITFEQKRYPLAFLTAHCVGVGIVFLRSRGKWSSPMKYHITSIVAGGVSSGIVRGIMKVKLASRAAKGSNSSDNATD